MAQHIAVAVAVAQLEKMSLQVKQLMKMVLLQSSKCAKFVNAQLVPSEQSGQNVQSEEHVTAEIAIAVATVTAEILAVITASRIAAAEQLLQMANF
jgi:hypothetical protein